MNLSMRTCWYFCCILTVLPLYTHAIDIDGVLDDEEWGTAETLTDFVTVKPFTLSEPEYSTEVKIFTNEKGIYISFKNAQKRSTQRSERVQRDGNIGADKVQVIIDFDNSHVTAYGFEVGNGGSIRDGIWSNENNFSRDWDGNWLAQTSMDEDFWYAEIFIPWDVAPMAKAEGDRRDISLYVARQVAYLNKKYANIAADNNRPRFVSEFPVQGIENYSGSSVNFFVSATARQDLLEDKSYVDASFDVFWKPDSSKQLSLTVNPDFGQVESDNLVVNFSPDEVFFNEKRPFFTENQSLFDLRGAEGLRLVHTRRIGSAPDVGYASGSDINAALKYTSNGKQLSYGVFAVTEASEGLANGRDYYVGRLNHKSDALRLGYLATFVDRPDIDRTALSQTVDYDLELNEKWKLRGQFVYADVSFVNEDTGIKDSLSDIGTWYSLEHQITELWDHSLQMVHYGDEFEINDLGFLSRNNLNSFSYESTWRKNNYAKESLINSRNLELELFSDYNTQGNRLYNVVELANTWQFKNTAQLRLSGFYQTSGNDDRITRGNNVLSIDSGYSFGYRYVAKARKKFRYHHQVELSNLPVDGKGYELHFHPTYYINDDFSVELSLRYTLQDNWFVWQGDDAGGNNLDSFTRKQFETRLNINARISERQELRVKFEWLSLTAGAQDAFIVEGGGALLKQNRAVEDFSLSDTALQIRYKYELGPLSNIFVVYSRGGRAEVDEEENIFGQFDPGWRERTGDNFLIKIRYHI